MEGWRDGGMEGWRDGGMEGWRDGGMEGWRDGGREGGREGGKEGRKMFSSPCGLLVFSPKGHDSTYRGQDLLSHSPGYRVRTLFTY